MTSANSSITITANYKNKDSFLKSKLSDISIIKLGYSLRERLESSYSPDSTGIIQPKDVLDNNRIDFDDVRSIEITNANKFMLEDGEILLQSRGRFIAVVYNQPADRNFIASSLLLRIILKSEDFLPEYIALYLNSEIGQIELNRLSGTSAIKSITKSELGKLEIPVLQIDVQKRLVEYTESFNNWCELNKKQLRLQTGIFNNVVNKFLGENNG